MEVVGREWELSRLAGFLSLPHNRAAFILTGGRGLGKTTLREEGLGIARRRSLAVLPIRASESEAHFSFVGLADLLEGVDAEVFAALPVPQRRALEVALLRADRDDLAGCFRGRPGKSMSQLSISLRRG